MPYPGAGPIYQDLLAGTIDFFAGGTTPLPEGIKVLGTVGSRRSPAFPNVPTSAGTCVGDKPKCSSVPRPVSPITTTTA